MNSLQGFTYLEVSEMLERGLAQGHDEESWRRESVEFHLLKAEGHINQYRKVRANMLQSEENHLQNALCRLAMAMYVGDGDGKA